MGIQLEMTHLCAHSQHRGGEYYIDLSCEAHLKITVAVIGNIRLPTPIAFLWQSQAMPPILVLNEFSECVDTSRDTWMPNIPCCYTRCANFHLGR